MRLEMEWMRSSPTAGGKDTSKVSIKGNEVEVRSFTVSSSLSVPDMLDRILGDPKEKAISEMMRSDVGQSFLFRIYSLFFSAIPFSWLEQ